MTEQWVTELETKVTALLKELSGLRAENRRLSESLAQHKASQAQVSDQLQALLRLFDAEEA